MTAQADGSRYLVAAVGLNRQRQLAVMLSMVDIPQRARVLELGTDADLGYSALLLARASRGGTVVSVSESPRLTERSRQVHPLGTGRPRLSFHTGPLAAAWSPGAPYHVIMSQSRFGWLPYAWLTQCLPGASIVMPLDHGAATPRLYLRVTVDDRHRPTQPLVLVEVDPHPHHTEYDPAHDVDLKPDIGGYSVATCLAADTCA